MKASYKKEKGRRLELKFAKMIRDKGLDKNARRMPGSGAFYGFKTDQHNNLPYSFELKNQERVRLWDWFDQAKSRASKMKPPVLVMSANYRPILCAMEVDDFLNLLLELKQYKEGYAV